MTIAPYKNCLKITGNCNQLRKQTDSFSATKSKPERTNWLTSKFNYPKLS